MFSSKNNAKYFDEQGWLYFTKEIFDLLNPDYGEFTVRIAVLSDDCILSKCVE